MTIQERIAAALKAHQPSRWRSFTNENEILRCCGQDFGNATRKAVRGDYSKAVADFAAHQASVVAAIVREAQAEALREAADELTWVRPEKSPCREPEACCGSEASCDAMQPSTSVVGPSWLRARADRIEAAG